MTTTAEEVALLISEYVATIGQLKEYRKRLQAYRQQVAQETEPLVKRVEELQKTITEYLRIKELQGVRKGKNVCYLTRKPVALPAEEKLAKVLHGKDTASENPQELCQKLVRAMRSRVYKDDEYKEVLCLRVED